MKPSRAAVLRARALRHEARAKLLEAKAVLAEAEEDHAPAVEPTPHMTRSQYAMRSNVSEATITRWVGEGMPVLPIGTTYRIDAVAADEWRRTRPRTPTKAKPRAIETDEIDVSADLRAARGVKKTA